jgi:hypothetical protein
LLFLTHNVQGQTPSPFLRRTGDYLGSQLLLVGPILLPALIWSAAPSVRWLREVQSKAATAETAATKLFLVCMGWPVFLLFLLLAFKSKVQGNWAVMAWLTPTILLSGRLAEAWDEVETRRRAMFTAGACAASGIVLTVAMIFPQIAYASGIRVKADKDQTNSLIGWRETAARVQQVRNEMGRARPVFIAGSGYQYCAELAFYLPDHPMTYDMFLHYRLDMYAAYVEDLKLRMGTDAIFVNDGETEDSDLRTVFTDVTWDPPFEIFRHPYYSKPIRTVHIARCKGYRLYTGTSWHVGG